MPPFDALNVVYVDCQTTGGTPRTGSLIEVAWSFSRACDPTLEIESRLLFPTDFRLPKRIENITGIGHQELATKGLRPEPVAAEFLSDVASHPETVAFVIHYARFEMPFLKSWLSHVFKESQLPLPVICTYELAKKLLPPLPTRGVQGLAGYFGFPYELHGPKRALAHVEATHAIWKGLCKELAQTELKSLDELTEFIARPKAKARTKPRLHYLMDRSKRLQLPAQPGVYVMRDASSQILYVGKATSLKSRVNSYFRKQKGRDPRLTQLLMRVQHIDVHVQRSPLEAALLESDTIKKHSPPYNVSLKKTEREFRFWNRTLDRWNAQPTHEFIYGPFLAKSQLDPLWFLVQNWKQIGAIPEIFYDPVPTLLREAGIQEFCQRHGIQREMGLQTRQWIALAVWRARCPPPPSNRTAARNACDVADKIERLLARAGQEWIIAYRMRHLANCSIEFLYKRQWLSLKVHAGRIWSDSEATSGPASMTWDAPTFDRLRILMSELDRLPHRIEFGRNVNGSF